MPRFDYAISLGTVMQALSIIATILIFGNRMYIALTELRRDHLAAMRDIAAIKTEVHELKRDIVDALEKRVRDVELGLAVLRK